MLAWRSGGRPASTRGDVNGTTDRTKTTVPEASASRRRETNRSQSLVDGSEHTENVEELLHRADPEDRLGGLEKSRMRGLVGGVAAALAAFHLWSGFSGGLGGYAQRAVHVCGALLVIWLVVYSRGKIRGRVLSLALAPAAVAAVGLCAYVAVNPAMVGRGGAAGTMLLVWAALTLLVVLETGRRTAGALLSGFCLALATAVLGAQVLPLAEYVARTDVTDMIDSLFFSSTGIFGSTTGSSATVIALFLVLGAFLEASGGALTLVNLARGMVGRFRGGTAKISLVTSPLFGTVSGSAVANVVVDGVFNIPLMKKAGFRPEFAAATEASASSGGQIVPPVMGAAAFIMAEYISVPYQDIVLAAIIPAALYYAALLGSVHIEALKCGMRPGRTGDHPRLRDLPVVRTLGAFVVPIGVMMALMYQFDASLMLAGSWAIATSILYILVFEGDSVRAKAGILWGALVKAGLDIAKIACIVAVAQLIVAVISLSGTVTALTNLLANVDLPQLASLGIIGMACLWLGAGVPTAAAYVLTATLATPLFFALDVPIVAGHMFILYLTVYANVSPPVAAAVFPAAAIAGAGMGRSMLCSMRLLAPAMLIPFSFVLHPGLLLGQGASLLEAVIPTIVVLVGAVIVSCGLARWALVPLRLWQGVVLAVAGVLIALPGGTTQLVGAACGLLVLVPAAVSWARSRSLTEAHTEV